MDEKYTKLLDYSAKCEERNDFRRLPWFQMEEDSDLPPGVCCSCSEDALHYLRFRRLCADSLETWHQSVNSLSAIDYPTDEDKTYYIFYNNGVETLVRDQISNASNTTEALERLTTRVETKTPRKKIERVIKNCECPDCGKMFTMPYFLNQHLKASMKRACTQCGEVMPKNALAKHLFKVHDITVRSCGVCSKVFDNASALEFHFQQQHSDVTNMCTTCGISFGSHRGLNAHMYNHKLFNCSLCNISFENCKCYRHHQKQCNIRRETTQQFNIYICDDCGAKYDKKPSLKMHIIQKHLHVLPYACQTCGKRTSTLAHLRSHETVHSTERKLFLCHCGAEMRTYLGFQLHQRIHSGEKPYQCDECGDRFLSASRRLDHIKRRHRSSKDMPHGCEKCDARFVRPFELKKHYMSVHYSNVDVKPAKKRLRRVF